MSKDAVEEVYGVPPIFMTDYAEAGKLANAEIQRLLLWDTLFPKVRKMTEIINLNMMPMLVEDPQNYKFEFDLSNINALLRDQELLKEKYDTGFDSGAITPNEYRVDILGKEPVDDPALNTYYIKQNLIPLTIPGQGKQNELQIRIENFKNSFPLNVDKISTKLNAVKQKMIQNMKEQRIVNIINKTIASMTRINQRQVKKFVPELEKLFLEQGKEASRNFRKRSDDKGYAVTKISNDLLNIQEWIERFTKVGRPVIEDTVILGGQDLSKDLDETFDLQDPTIPAYVNKESISYATVVNQTTVNNIDTIIRNGISDQLTIAEIANEIEGYFTSQARYRSERIARTEVIRATNFGRQTSMLQSSTVTHKRWVTQHDSDVRDTHAELDGVVVPVGDPFPVSGAYKGDPMYPSDINERCFHIPAEKPEKN